MTRPARNPAEEAYAALMVLLALHGATVTQLWAAAGPLSKVALERHGFDLKSWRAWMTRWQRFADAQHAAHETHDDLVQVAELFRNRVAVFQNSYAGDEPCTIEDIVDSVIGIAHVGRPKAENRKPPRFVPRLRAASQNLRVRARVVRTARRQSRRARPSGTRGSPQSATSSSSDSDPEPGPAAGVSPELWRLSAKFDTAAARRNLANANQTVARTSADLVVLELLRAGLLEAWIDHVLHESGGAS